MPGRIRSRCRAHLTHLPSRQCPYPAHIISCVQAVLSPLLSNIVLDEFDWELERRGLRFARYADDGNIYVRSRRAGERGLSCTEKLSEPTRYRF